MHLEGREIGSELEARLRNHEPGGRGSAIGPRRSGEGTLQIDGRPVAKDLTAIRIGIARECCFNVAAYMPEAPPPGLHA